MSSYIRPNPVQWIRYAFGASLPEKHREWVLHDNTTPSWAIRHVIRSVVQLAGPILAVLILVPGPFGIRVLTVVAAGAPAVLIMVMMIAPMSQSRLLKAGYPANLGDKIRHERAINAQRSANAARRERVATRRAAREVRRSGSHDLSS